MHNTSLPHQLLAGIYLHFFFINFFQLQLLSVKYYIHISRYWLVDTLILLALNAHLELIFKKTNLAVLNAFHINIHFHTVHSVL